VSGVRSYPSSRVAAGQLPHLVRQSCARSIKGPTAYAYGVARPDQYTHSCDGDAQPKPRILWFPEKQDERQQGPRPHRQVRPYHGGVYQSHMGKTPTVDDDPRIGMAKIGPVAQDHRGLYRQAHGQRHIQRLHSGQDRVQPGEADKEGVPSAFRAAPRQATSCSKRAFASPKEQCPYSIQCQQYPMSLDPKYARSYHATLPCAHTSSFSVGPRLGGAHGREVSPSTPRDLHV